MPSPFPGMDPYLESPTHWSDFHGTFVPALRKAINDRLPAEYVARIGEHVSVVAPVLQPPAQRAYVPDVTVVRRPGEEPGNTGGREGAAGGVATLPPRPVTLRNIEFLDPHTEAYIEVVRLPEREVVTVIELFSPTNKYGEGRGEYMRKRRALLRQPVNVVKLDLLRAGARIEFSDPLPPGDYFALVSRTASPGQTDVYGWSIRDPLPDLIVPLRAPDPDVRVPLRPPFDEAYESGRYWKVLDYTRPPPPPSLSTADAEWARHIAAGEMR